MKDQSPYESPYASPKLEAEAPPVRARPSLWWLFRVYAALMTFVYIALVFGGAFLFLLAVSDELDREDTIEAYVYGVMMVLVGIPFAMFFAVGIFLPRRGWAYGVSMALICIGLTSPCTMPFSIPLLIQWIKPETRQYFQSG